jgi:FkbM family methyltransferase
MRSRFLWRALRARYRDDRRELAAIRAAIRPDGVAVDVGANRGAYLYWLSRWTSTGRVVAFEPQQELARYLSDVAVAMGLDNVTVEARGVADRAGELEFYVPGGVVTPGASFSRRVPEREPCTRHTREVVTLDGYFAAGTPISVIKVDVEGLELRVFQGAQRILAETSPLLVFECENRHLEEGGVEDVLRFLADCGYDGHFVLRGRLVPACRFDAAVHQKEVGERFFAAKDYGNNFILRKVR